MKATASQHGHDTNSDSGGSSKRRFRFARRGMEDDLQQLDDIASQVNALTEPSQAPVEPQREMHRDDEVSTAALAALDQLNERLRTASEVATAHQPAPETTNVNTSTYTQNPAATNADATQAQGQAQAQAQAPQAPVPAERYDAMMIPAGAPRMRATMPAPAAAYTPTPMPAPVVQTQTPAVLAPVKPSTPMSSYGRPTDMLVDVTRILRTLEEEADLARDRIEHEVANAREEADTLLHAATIDADRLRDHAQQQARVLLSEVEEIISEAQHTGEQILKAADQDSDSIRQQAGHTLVQAQEEAHRIVDHARREGEQILAEQRRLATVRAQEALREQDRLKDQIHRLEERRGQVLESLGPMIDQLSQMIPADRNVIDFPGARR